MRDTSAQVHCSSVEFLVSVLQLQGALRKARAVPMPRLGEEYKRAVPMPRLGEEYKRAVPMPRLGEEYEVIMCDKVVYVASCNKRLVPNYQETANNISKLSRLAQHF